MRKYAPYLLPLYMLVIVLVHVLPFGSDMAALNKVQVVSIRLDYLLHALAFMPWAVLLWLLYGVSFRKDHKKALLWLIAGIMFAAAAEYVQYFLPYRAFNINDVLGNVTGVVAGGLVLLWNPPKIAAQYKNVS